MKVLLTNHHMGDRAGSELLVTELAEGLKARGHEVAIFTLFPGAFAEAFTARSTIPIHSPLSDDVLARGEPDVIHATHWPTLVHLRGLGVAAPAVHAFLGVLPPLENPPPVTGGGPPVAWCVSDEVAANVASVDGWPAVDQLTIARTAIAPGFEVPRRSAPQALRQVAIVSNHFPGAYRRWLGELGAELGFELDVLGLPDNPVDITPEYLASRDAVITLGRTAIAAAGMGVPTLVLDANGSDGWLTPVNLRRSQWHNYSGRGLGIEPDKDLLRQWLQAPPAGSELDEVADVVRRDHAFATMLDEVEALLGRACADRSAPTFGRHCDVVHEYIVRIHQQQAVLATVTAERDVATAQLERSLRECELTHDALDHAVAGRVAAERSLEDVVVERGHVQTERDDARTQLADLKASTSWKLTAPLRSVTGRLRNRS